MTIEQASAVNTLIGYCAQAHHTEEEHAKAKLAAQTLARGAHRKLLAGWTPERVHESWMSYHEANTSLALWFTPQAIRDHFDGDEDERSEWVANATDEQLAAVGQDALGYDSIYREFHESLAVIVDDAMTEKASG